MSRSTGRVMASARRQGRLPANLVSALVSPLWHLTQVCFHELPLAYRRKGLPLISVNS